MAMPITNQCPCARKVRIPEVADPENLPPYAAGENTLCIFCDRILFNTLPGNRPDHASWDDEVHPSDFGQATAARARAGLIRGRPIDNPPVRNPKPRP